MDYFIAPGQTQYKANLHSHSVRSDGHTTPEESVKRHKEHGYSILAITDHEAPYDHSALTTDDFLLITGYEAYIRPSKICKGNHYKPEIHLNLIAKEPDNVNLIGYNPVCCKYINIIEQMKLPHPDKLWNRKFTVEYIQKFIDSAVRNGYLVSLNHPCWSMQATEELLQLKNYYSVEIFNYASMLVSGYAENMPVYDAILRSGNMVYCHGSDDNHNEYPLDHPLSDSFGAWTMIMADKLDYPSVIKALENGNFYASTGPEIKVLGREGNKFHIETSDVRRITMHVTPKLSRVEMALKGQTVNSADFKIPAGAPYVYFSAIAEDGTRAYTHAFKV